MPVVGKLFMVWAGITQFDPGAGGPQDPGTNVYSHGGMGRATNSQVLCLGAGLNGSVGSRLPTLAYTHEQCNSVTPTA